MENRLGVCDYKMYRKAGPAPESFGSGNIGWECPG